MPVGEWTVDGSAEDLRALSVRLRATGQSGLKRNITSAITLATKPAKAAVKAELLAVMPKAGGLNVAMAKTPIRAAVLTGPKTAGIVLRRKSGRKVESTGQVRHPVFGNRQAWTATNVATGWWEHALEGFGVPVREALIIAQNLTAKEAGFI